MSKKRFFCFLRNFLILILLILSSAASLQAEDDPSLLPASSSFEKSDYYREISFSKTPMNWYRDNQSSLPLLSLREQDLRLNRMEQDIITWSEREFESRLPLPDYDFFISSMDELSHLWTFRMEEGEILFDEAGDPLLRSAEAVDVGVDKASWLAEVENLEQILLTRWMLSSESILGSLLTGIPDNYKETIEQNLKISLLEYCSLIEKESDRLINWSSAKIDYLRFEDNYSLRHKSEDKSAAGIADSLLSDIRDELDDVEEVLSGGLQDIHDISMAEGLSADSEDWEVMFRREFQKGLDRWSSAEQSFLAERLDWELRAEKAFHESEESWNDAYRLFEGARNEWVSALSEKLEEGLIYWEGEEEAYMLDFRRIAEELETAAQEQEKKFAAQVESAISLYSDSYSLLCSAEENLSYYRNRIEYCNTRIDELQTSYDNSSDAVTADAAGSGRTVVSKGTGISVIDYAERLQDIEDLKGERSLYQDEYNIWQTLQSSLTNQMETARILLFDLESTASGYDETTAYGQMERDIKTMSNKAERLFIQWEISEIVALYALTDSALRDTEAETAVQYERADSELLLAELRYNDAIQSLKLLRDDLALKQLGIDEIREVLREAEASMMDAEKSYESSKAVYLNDDPQIIETVIDDLNKRLDLWFAGSPEDAPERERVFSELIAAGEWERRNEHNERLETILRDLAGSELPLESDNFDDLDDLQAALDSLYMLREFDPYPGLEEALLNLESEQDLLSEIEWNNQLRGYISEFREPEEIRPVLESNLNSAGMSLLIHKVTCLQEFMITLYEGTSADGWLRNEYLDFLKENGFSPGGEDIKTISNLLSALQHSAMEGLCPEEAEALLKGDELLWVQALQTGNGMLPSAENLSLFVSDSRAVLLRAEAALSAYESVLTLTSSFRSLSAEGCLYAESGEEFIEKLENFESLESILDWYLPLMNEDTFPQYMELGLNASILQRFGSELDSFLYEGTEDEEEAVRQYLTCLKSLKESEQSLSLKDPDFIRTILKESFNTLQKESVTIPAETFRSSLNRFYENEIIMNSNLSTIEEMKYDLQLKKEGSESFKELVVDRDRALYFASRDEYELVFEDLRSALDSFNASQELFLQGQGSVEVNYGAYMDASNAFQLAKEIYDYARGAYSSEDYNVYTVRDDRRSEYEKCSEALAVLKQVESEIQVGSEADSVWTELLDDEQDILSVTNKASFARQELIKELGELNQEQGNTLRDLTDFSTDLIDFSFRDDLSFSYDSDVMTRAMSSFTGWSNGNYNQYLDHYFSQTGISEIFTKDLLLWLNQISSHADTSKVLKQFSYAYYHELRQMEGMDWDTIKSKYTIDLFNDPRHSDLLDTEGSFFKSAHIGYEGDLDRFEKGEYETFESGILYEGEYLKIFISGEEWLQEQTASSFSTIKRDTALYEEYSFYKMLMFSDAFKSDSLKHAMEKDLSLKAWLHIDACAAHEQSRFKNIWGGLSKTGKDIRDKRNTLELSARGFSGIQGRSFAASCAEGSVSLLQDFSRIEARIGTLTPDAINSAEEIEVLLRNICGVSLSEDQRKITSQAFNPLSSFDKSSALNLLDGLMQELSRTKTQVLQKRQIREEELKSAQMEQHFVLQSIIHSADWDPSAFRTAAVELYGNSPFQAEICGLRSLESVLSADDPYEQESLFTLQSYGGQLCRNFHDRLLTVKEKQYNSLQVGLENLKSQKIYWEELSEGLGREGLNQWASSFKDLISERNDWHEQIIREFAGKSGLWEKKYNYLLFQKNSWVQQSSRNVLEHGAQTFAREWDLEADRLISDLNYNLITDLVSESGSASDLVYDVLKGRTMDTLLNSVGNLSLRSSSVFAPQNVLPSIPDKQSAVLQIDESHRELTEKVYKAMSYSRALQMKELVDHVELSITENLDDANRSVDDSIEAQLGDAGYLRQGNSFTRTVLIDSSLIGGNEKEAQVLRGYRYFEAPGFDHKIDLRPESLILLSSEMIQASVELAQKRLNRYVNLIFGNEEDGDIRSGLDRSFIAFLEDAEHNYKNSAQFNDDENADKKGLFNYYLGYAPVMDEDEPEQVASAGYGEFGRIYEKFFIHQARLFRGLSSVNTPWYSQKLWDDDSDNDGESDSLLGAPSVRTLSDIALNIAGNFLAPGIGPLMLNLVDNALFSILDLGNGIADLGQVSLDFLKSAGSSLIASGTQSLGGLMDNFSFLQNSGVMEVAGDIGIRGMTSVASNYGTAALYSLDPESQGWNWNTFNSMTSWDNTGARYLGGMAGTAVSGTLSLGTFGFINEMGDDASSFTGLLGGLSTSGVEYAMTGQAKFNLVNLGRPGTGFLEMNIGDRSTLFNFGTGGTDLSPGTLSAAARGLAVYTENLKINNAVEKDLRAGMRALYSSDMDETETLYQEILSGDTVLTLSENSDYQGYTDVDGYGRRIIDLNKSGQSQLDLAVLLGHEAFRDGLTGSDEAQVLETIDAVTGHMAMGVEFQKRYGADNLSEDNNREAFAYRLYTDGAISREELAAYIEHSYDTSADYWKRLEDGRIISDGKAGLYDEIGNLIRVATDRAGNQLDEMDSLQYYIDSDTAAYLSFLTPEQRSKITYFRSSEDINRQVETRDSIINDYEILRNLNSKSILTGSDYQKAMDSLFQSMAMYNNEYILRGIAITPEGVISQTYGNVANRMETRKDGETQFLSYTHPGIDTSGGEGIYSPGFVIPGSDVKNYAFGLDIIGMENSYLLEHMNPADVDELLLKELVYPGQKLMEFPELMFPSDGGGTGDAGHAHIELSTYNSEAESWGFSDPSGDWSDWASGDMFPGYYEWLDVDEYGNEEWTLNSKLFWKKWKPWYPQ